MAVTAIRPSHQPGQESGGYEREQTKQDDQDDEHNVERRMTGRYKRRRDRRGQIEDTGHGVRRERSSGGIRACGWVCVVEFVDGNIYCHRAIEVVVIIVSYSLGRCEGGTCH